MDPKKTRENCSEYAKSHSRSIEVLRKANGKDDYKQIAKSLGMHYTKVSGLLRLAEKYGLATKQDGVYKKSPGVLQHMPRINQKRNHLEPISKAVAKWTKIKPKFKSYQHETFGIALNNPSKMAESYLWLYRTENTLRELVRLVFQGQQNWWNNRVNPQIRQKVQDAQNDYPYDGAKRKDELEYTHLGQLKEVIIGKANWNLFLPHLNEKDKSKFGATVDKAIPSRNSIAHCTPLTGDDFKYVEIRFKDILTMIR